MTCSTVSGSANTRSVTLSNRAIFTSFDFMVSPYQHGDGFVPAR